MSRLALAVAALAVASAPAAAHVDQPKPPAVKQSKLLRSLNHMAMKLNTHGYDRDSAGFTWNRARNRFRTYWKRTHPPRPHAHWNTDGAPRDVIWCESKGNPRAVSADGQYRGLYQFSFSTWASVGGSGDPAAASPDEQHHRAAILFRRAGSSPWPVCG